MARATRYCFAPLLEPLRLAGCVITAVAVHTQREHASSWSATNKPTTSLITGREGESAQPVRPGQDRALAEHPRR